MMSELVLRLWPVALMAAPLALIAHLLCRVLPMRPSTRHSLFLGVLVFLLLAPLLPAPPAFDVSGLLASTSKPVAPITAAPADHADLSLDSDAAETTPLSQKDLGAAQLLTIASKPESAVPRRITWFWPTGPWQPPIPFTVGQDETPPLNSNHAPESAVAQTNAPSITPARPAPPASTKAADVAPPAMATAREQYASSKRFMTAAPAPRFPTEVQAEPCDDPATATLPPAAATPTALSPSIAWEAVRLASLDLALAVSQLPPLPPLIWCAGSLLVILVIGFRFLQFTLLLRRATPAPDEVTQRVADAARELGVRRVPVTVMTDARVSPMVALAPRRLLLPVGLWGQLDEVGQRAVLYHELAHLARRDHWVCWLDLMVSILYWWHPVAWWMRRRLCEEADLSCDAWVINLLPRSRRAYATALLESRVYTTTRTVGPGLPSMALGASHIRKRRFARRLTMVMTKDSTPRRTLTGIALAGTVITLGWLVSPAFACPPDQDDAPKRRVIKITESDSSDKCTTQKDTDCTSDDDATSTFERFMRGRERGDVSMDDKLEMLEAHLETMAMRLTDWAENIDPEQLAEIEAHLSQLKNVDLDQLRGHLAHIQHADLSELAGLAEIAELQGLDQLAEYVDLSVLAELAQNIDLSELSELSEYVNLDELKGHLIALGDIGDGPVVLGRGGGIGVGGGGPVLYGDNRISRVYHLPEGKLEAITNLMKLDNVPILISPRDDGIELHATQSQHMIFNAFVTMINAEDLEESYTLEGSKLSALTELMSRKDVPVMVVPGDDSIGVQGDSLQQLIFGAFVKMISPEPGPDFNMSPPSGDSGDRSPITVGSGTGGGYTIGRAETRARKYEARARQEVQRIQAMEHHHAELTHQYDAIAAHAEGMERHAEELYAEIERLEEIAGEIEEKADGLDARDRVKLIHKYNEIVSKAHALRNEARVIEIEAEVREAEMEEIEELAETLEDEMDDLADELEELADALEDEDDDDDLGDEI